MNIARIIFYLSFLCFLSEVVEPSAKFVRNGSDRNHVIAVINLESVNQLCTICTIQKKRASNPKKIPIFKDRSHTATARILHSFDPKLDGRFGEFDLEQASLEAITKPIDHPPQLS
jgi:hypothetical protein